MTKSSKKITQRHKAASKQKLRRTLNPAENRLTNAEDEVYKIISSRQSASKTTTSGDVAADWGGKNRSYTYKVIKSLMLKGFVEQYSKRFYKLTELKGEKCHDKN